MTGHDGVRGRDFRGYRAGCRPVPVGGAWRLGSRVGASLTAVTVVVASPGVPLSGADQTAAAVVAGRLARVAHVVSVRDAGVSADGAAVQFTVLASLTQNVGAAPAQQAVLCASLRSVLRSGALPAGLMTHLAGPATRVDNNAATGSSGAKVQWVSIIFVIALLVAMFRSVLAPFVAVLPAVLVVLVASRLTAVVALHGGLAVSQIASLLLIVLVLGAGTDYALFLMFRVRELMRSGLACREAITEAVARVGETITFSAGVLIAALGSLAFATFGLYSGAGSSAVDRYRADAAGRAHAAPGAAVAAGGYVAAGFGGPVTAPAGSDSAAGDALLAAHFPATAVNPTLIVLRLRAPVWAVAAEVAAAEASLRADPLFTAVTGPLDPNGSVLSASEYSALYRQYGAPRAASAAAGGSSAAGRAYLASGSYVSADGRTIAFATVLAAGNATTTAAARVMPLVRALAARAASRTGASAYGVDGQPAFTYDIAQLSDSDLALGEDYNILVMTRIREEAARLPLREAVSQALAVTGSTVSSAGLVLALTFGVLAVVGSGSAGAANVQTILDVGVGLALGVLMDTFLVRTLLVPSAVILIGRWNWWPSRASRASRLPALQAQGGVPGRADAEVRGDELLRRRVELAVARVAGEPGMSTTRYLQPDPVPRLEAVGHTRERNPDLAGQRGVVEADDAIGHVARRAARVNVAEPHEQVCVLIVAGHRQFDGHVTDELDRLIQRRTGEDQDIAALLDRLVVPGSGGGDHRRSAYCRRGIGRVIAEFRILAIGLRLLSTEDAARTEKPALLSGARWWPVRKVPPLAGAADIDTHRTGQRLGTSAAVEPLEALFRHQSGPGCIQVRPRPDDQPRGHSPGVQDPVLLDALMEEQVMPPANQQRRDVDALQRGAALQRLPERVGRPRMLQPGLEPRGAGAEQCTDTGGERHPVQHRDEPPVRGRRPVYAMQEPDAFLERDELGPLHVVIQIEHAVAVNGATHVVRPDLDDGRHQLRRRVHGQRPLDEPEIAPAVRRQPPVEPALLPQPGDRVLSVRDLVPHRLEIAAGTEGASTALHQHVIAALGDQLGHGHAERRTTPVGAADQHRRGRLAGDRNVVVGEQDRTIGHRHGQLRIDDYLAAARRQGPRPRQHRADRVRPAAYWTGSPCSLCGGRSGNGHGTSFHRPL